MIPASLAFLGGLLLGAALGWSRLRRLRRVLEELVRAEESDAPFLLDRDRGLLRKYSIERLVNLCETRRHEINRMSRLGRSRLEQLKLTFSRMREGVMVVDRNNRIVLSNQIANQYFNAGRSIEGLAAESVIHNPVFLDLLSRARRGEGDGRQEVESHRERRTLWFEISASRLDQFEDGDLDYLFILVHDITRLKTLEAIRRDFVANVSHELRTPITIVKGFSETLARDFPKLTPERRLSFIEKIRRNSDRLHHLVDDLLSLSRLESDPGALRLEPLPANELVRQFFDPERVGEMLGPIRLVLDLEPEDTPVHTDRLYFSQILRNLVENAVRHGRTTSVISVSTKLIQPDEYWMVVRDDGQGIPEREIDRIFQRFYRVEGDRSRERTGTGLGLSIVKHAMLSSGGRAFARRAEPTGTEIVCVFRPASR